jgi:hypothetical protein
MISNKIPGCGSPQTHNTIHRERGTLVLIQQTIDSTMCNTTCSFDDASLPTDEPAAMVETTESASNAAVEDEEDEEESLEGVGKMIQDLSHSDNAKVNAALDALNQDPDKDKEKYDTVTVWGGCAALVHLLKDRLKKAMKKVRACDQATELNELPELATINNTLRAIVWLTYYSEIGRIGIATVGGGEAVAKVMKTFPKCQTLQEYACSALRNLACCSIGKTKVVESGGIGVLLAAINNHLGSPRFCSRACEALYNIVLGSREFTGLLISLGGGAVVAKVRIKWPDNDKVQTQVQQLARLFAEKWKAWEENTELPITLGGGAAVAKVRRKWPDNDEIQTWVRRL